MGPPSFMNRLVASKLAHNELIRLKEDATSRFGIHQMLFNSSVMAADENSSLIHRKHVDQTILKLNILDSIVTYRLFLSQDGRPPEESESPDEEVSNTRKKRSAQPSDSFSSVEKRDRLVSPSSSQCLSANACLRRPTDIAPASPCRVFCVNSAAANQSTTYSSMTILNGIRRISTSTVSSTRAPQQLMSSISPLQINTLTHSSRSNAVGAARHPIESLPFRGENEMRREHWAKFEGSHHSSNSISASHESQSSSNEHHHQHDSLARDFDSSVSSHSTSSIIHHEGQIEQPKFFDRERRLLADEQHLPVAQVD